MRRSYPASIDTTFCPRGGMTRFIRVLAAVSLACLGTACGYQRYYTFETGHPKNPYRGSTVLDNEAIKIAISPVWYSLPYSSDQANIYVDVFNKTQKDIALKDVSLETCQGIADDLQLSVNHLQVVGHEVKNAGTGFMESPRYKTFDRVPEALKIVAPAHKDVEARRLLFDIKTPSFAIVERELETYCVRFHIRFSQEGGVHALQPTYLLQRKSQGNFWFLRDG